MLTGVAFGLAPAFRAIGTDLTAVIQGVGTARRRVALKYGMVAFQVALSLVLLVGTGLVLRSMVQMERVTEDSKPQFHRRLDQQGSPAVSFIVRSAGDQAAMVGTLSRVVRDVDRALPVLRAATFDDYLARQFVLPRISVGILAGFSVVALIPARRATRVDPLVVLRYQ